MTGQRTATTATEIRGGTVTVAEAADALVSSLRAASLNTWPRHRADMVAGGSMGCISGGH